MPLSTFAQETTDTQCTGTDGPRATERTWDSAVAAVIVTDVYTVPPFPCPPPQPSNTTARSRSVRHSLAAADNCVCLKCMHVQGDTFPRCTYNAADSRKSFCEHSASPVAAENGILQFSCTSAEARHDRGTCPVSGQTKTFLIN